MSGRASPYALAAGIIAVVVLGISLLFGLAATIANEQTMMMWALGMMIVGCMIFAFSEYLRVT